MKKLLLLLTTLMIFITVSNAETVVYLNDINIIKSAYNTVINVSLSEQTSFKEGKLTDNNKIYIDFKNTVIREPFSASVRNNFVSSVRAAQNATKPEYITRVVFDMDKLTDYKIETYDNKNIKVIFEEKNTDKINAEVIQNTDKINTEVTQNTDKINTEVTQNNEDTTSRGGITRVPVNNTIIKQKDKLIVIDAGHGGKDPGAIFSNIQEKSLNLDIAKRLRKLLEAEGYEIIMTRTTDEFIELEERAAIANRNNADLFISVHNNSMPESYRGTMTLYSPRDAEEEFSSKDLAQVIQKNMEQSLSSGSIGARERTNLVVLNKTTMPAIIAEVACMSNEAELNLLKTAVFRQAAAQGICNAILELDF